MEQYRLDKDFTLDEFIKEINRARLEANGWFVFECYVEGVHFITKCYKTWPQILKYDGVNIPAVMDMKVGEWKKLLTDMVNKKREAINAL